LLIIIAEEDWRKADNCPDITLYWEKFHNTLPVWSVCNLHEVGGSKSLHQFDCRGFNYALNIVLVTCTALVRKVYKLN
jgi:hypothetical protein